VGLVVHVHQHDGIVIGSAIITKIDEGKDKLEDFLKEISESLKDK